MITDQKQKKSLADSLIDVYEQPAILLDANAALKSVNETARKFFGHSDFDNSSTSLILNDTELQKLIHIMEELPAGEVKKNEFHFQTASGEKKNEVTIKLINEGDEVFFLLLFNGNTNGAIGKAHFGVSVPVADLEDLVDNKRILSIISDIQSSFPFTFLGKNRIQNEINKLNEPFWIKDFNDKFIIVNAKYSQSAGLKPMQLEGKPEGEFIPPFYRGIYSSLQQFVKESANIIVTDGIPVKGGALVASSKTIQVPIVDSEKRVIACICFSQQGKHEFAGKIINQAASFIDNVFAEFHAPAMIIDANGIIKQLNKEFCILQNIDFNESSGVHYNNILESVYSQKVDNFINSSQTEQFFHYTVSEGESNEILYQARLKKIKLSEEDFVLLLALEKILSYDNLEELLKNRGRMFDILIRYNPEAIFIYDAENLRFIEVNDAALRLYGYRREEFLQMDLTDLYTPEDIQTLLDSSSSKNTASEYTGPFKHKRKDGTVVMVELSKTPFQYENTEAHFNIVKDVSESIEKEKQFQLFKAAFEHTSDMLFITDSVGFIKYVNNSVKSVIGHEKHELIDFSFVTLAKDEERGVLNSSIFYSHLKEPVETEVVLKKKEGGEVKCKIFATPILNMSGEVDSYNILAIPEVAPVEVIKEVEKVVIKEVVKEVVKDKSAYSDNVPASAGLDTTQISAMFHDVLTPINVILGFVQEIRESLEAPTEEQSEALDFISQNRDNLLEIMNSISEYSAIGSIVSPKTVEIVSVIESLESDLRQSRDKWKKELVISRVSSSLQIYSDTDKISSWLLLLVKLCSRLSVEQQVYLSVQLLDEDNFIISVKDNLAKISDRLLENYQDIVVKKDFGMAKALGISKFSVMSFHKILDLLNGTEEFVNKDGHIFEIGYRFPVNLEAAGGPVQEVSHIPESVPEPAPQRTVPAPPAFEPAAPPARAAAPKPMYQPPKPAPAPAPAPPPPPAQPAPPPVKRELELSKLNCLYIEDQVDSQILFKVQMKELNDIKFAVSFEEALPMMSMYKFDFIVMDINLQGEYNGLDALKIIRTMPDFLHLPIVAVTAYVLPGDKEKFIAAGFNDFISKPIFREKMIDALSRIFA